MMHNVYCNILYMKSYISILRCLLFVVNLAEPIMSCCHHIYHLRRINQQVRKGHPPWSSVLRMLQNGCPSPLVKYWVININVSEHEFCLEDDENQCQTMWFGGDKLTMETWVGDLCLCLKNPVSSACSAAVGYSSNGMATQVLTSLVNKRIKNWYWNVDAGNRRKPQETSRKCQSPLRSCSSLTFGFIRPSCDFFAKVNLMRKYNMMVSGCVKSILSCWILLTVAEAASFKSSQTIGMFFGPPCPPPLQHSNHLKTLRMKLQYVAIFWKIRQVLTCQ